MLLHRKAPPPPPPTLLGCYAGFISRLLSEIVDVLAISLSFFSLTWFVSVTTTILQLRTFLGFSINRIPGSARFIDALFGPISATIFLLAFIAAYHIFFWVLTGQTPGKALLGLRVVTLEGRRLSPLRGLLRILSFIVSGAPLYLGFLWILVDDRRQGWHDKLAGTYVVYAWAAIPDERFLAEEIQQVAPNSIRHNGL